MPEAFFLSGAACVICGEAKLRELVAFRALPRVTSDCKPHAPGGKLFCCAACGAVQKVADQTWRREASSIYAAYALYAAAGGEEQGVGDADEMMRRSSVLVKRMVEEKYLREGASLLDFGSGTGAFLRAAASACGSCSLYALDLSDKYLRNLESIDGFRRLYVGDVERVDRTFDLISMVHSLEHLEDPVGSLAALSTKLASDGSVFVQVPDWRRNYFDLLVADHLMHFDLRSLRMCAGRAKLTMRACEHWVSHELSATVSLVGDGGAAGDEVLDESEIESAVAWLQATLQSAVSFVSAENRPFAIFGTAIAGSWLYGALRDKPVIFIDEDRSRVGGSHLGVPIVHPDDVPSSTPVLIPLRPDISRRVASRYEERWQAMWMVSEPGQ